MVDNQGFAVCADSLGDVVAAPDIALRPVAKPLEERGRADLHPLALSQFGVGAIGCLEPLIAALVLVDNRVVLALCAVGRLADAGAELADFRGQLVLVHALRTLKRADIKQLSGELGVLRHEHLRPALRAEHAAGQGLVGHEAVCHVLLALLRLWHDLGACHLAGAQQLWLYGLRAQQDDLAGLSAIHASQVATEACVDHLGFKRASTTRFQAKQICIAVVDVGQRRLVGVAANAGLGFDAGALVHVERQALLDAVVCGLHDLVACAALQASAKHASGEHGARRLAEVVAVHRD